VDRIAKHDTIIRFSRLPLFDDLPRFIKMLQDSN
jgi:hypothetical protein